MDDVYAKQGFGNRLGFGRSPALLIVDFTVGFRDPECFGGGNIGPAISQTEILLERFRTAGLPVAHTRIVYADDGSDAGTFARKAPRLLELTEGSAIGQIVPELAPRAGELLVRKSQASAFCGTPLAAWLISRGVDTVVVAGCTTSGCVRASVVDAASSNFRPIVARECVGDRAMEPHHASLFDMEQKYADVISLSEVMAVLERG